MSAMPASHGHNEACCNIPPVVISGYQAKGSYKEFDNLKTYVTGPDDATKGIVVIYDIFGYFDQTIQGADILAAGHHQKYKVFMPDWFQGEPCPIEWLPEFVKALEAQNPSIKSWAVIGFCWGGKIVSLVTSSDNNPFSVGAECHPAMVDPSEAVDIKVPLIMLASKEEPEEEVAKFEANLKGAAKHVETFKDQVHGWMAARADLKDDRVKEEYSRGYKTVLEFFAKNWS
ncbi:hypothetical protein N0V88_003638 [Collariella sp. IMI 366227]|nr:hypothetical protein N0V88_003638 [Collariella sp. IMI 366227]